MTVEYQIIYRCACGEHRVYADYNCPVSDSMAHDDLMKQGWKYTGDHEFVCPQCQIEKAKPMTDIPNSDPMKPEHRVMWVNNQAAIIAEKFKQKYLNGQAEHKGDLGDVSIIDLLNEMEAEALDQLAYVRELKRRLKV